MCALKAIATNHSCSISSCTGLGFDPQMKTKGPIRSEFYCLILGLLVKRVSFI